MSRPSILLGAMTLLVSGSAIAQIANDPKEQEVIDTAAKPDSWVLEQLGGKRISMDGQTLDLRLQYRLDQGRKADEAEAKAAPPPDPNAPPAGDPFLDPVKAAAIRAEANQEWIRQTRPWDGGVTTTDEQVRSRGGQPIPVRIYKPKASGPLPVLVYYHGGGWVIGNIATIDRSMRRLADEAKVMIVSVDYRLSPENAYPAAWDDAEDAFDWTVANVKRLGGNPAKVCVGGDSAGGNMSVVVTARTQKAGKASPACQLLYYAAVDNRAVPDMRVDYPSSRLFWSGFGLDVPFTEYVQKVVFPGMDLSQPEISPIRANNFASMPPTVVAAAGFDPLRDSDRAYAEGLKKAGVWVRYLEYPSLRHGFMQHTRVTREADRAATETAKALADMLKVAKAKTGR